MRDLCGFDDVPNWALPHVSQKLNHTRLICATLSVIFLYVWGYTSICRGLEAQMSKVNPPISPRSYPMYLSHTCLLPHSYRGSTGTHPVGATPSVLNCVNAPVSSFYDFLAAGLNDFLHKSNACD